MRFVVRLSRAPLEAAVLAVAALALAAPGAAAQTARQGIEAGVGAGLIRGTALGGGEAELRTRAGTDFALFSADSRLGTAWELELRVGLSVTRRYGFELRGGFSHPELRTTISGDAEGAPGITLVQRIDQYVFDASFLAALDELRLGPVVPFAAAGAGYLRQLHEGLTLIEQGAAFHAGGGVKYRFANRGSGVVKGAGVRGDARLYVFSGGITLDDRPRPHIAASGSLFVVF